MRVDRVFCPEVRETAEHLFFNVSPGFELDQGHRHRLFSLGLGPEKVQKSVQRQIFNMISETNQLVWNVRNKVLFSYERQVGEKVKSLVSPILLRIKNEIHYNSTKSDR